MYSLDDYEEVKDRLPVFWERYPAGKVLTELVSDVADLSTVVFKATLYDGTEVLATGWAFEREGSSAVNRTSHLENCETSAVGRALANLGIHGRNRPSREEMRKASSDSPGDLILPMGKYRGHRLSEVDRGYLHWLVQGADLDRFPEVREAAVAYREMLETHEHPHDERSGHGTD